MTSTAREASPLWGSALMAAGSPTTVGIMRTLVSSAQVSVGPFWASHGAAQAEPGIYKRSLEMPPYLKSAHKLGGKSQNTYVIKNNKEFVFKIHKELLKLNIEKTSN